MEQDRKNKILQKLAASKSLYKLLSEAAESAAYKGSRKASLKDRAIGRVAGAPARAIGGTLRRLLVGGAHPSRPFFASQIRGMKVVNRSAAQRAKAQGKKVYRIKTPDGTKRMVETYGPGGLAGFAVKHPIITGGGVLLGTGALKSRRDRSINIYNQPPVQAAPAQPEFINWG